MLAVFTVKQLSIHHSENLTSSLFALCTRSERLSPIIDNVESSANSIGFSELQMLQMSLMYKRNNMGPNMLPCGTPRCTGSVCEDI